MIYTRIGKYGMIDAFRRYGRLKHFHKGITSETHGNFTVEAVEKLFDYYDELENYELDVVGICCEWTQYDDIDEAKETYDLVRDDAMDVFDYLEDNTYVIILDDDSILVRDF